LVKGLPMQNGFWFRYGLSLFSVGLATWLSVALRAQLEYTRSIFFVPAVIVSAWFGGVIGGLVATILSFLSLAYYMIPPHHSIFSVNTNFIELFVSCWLRSPSAI